MTNKYFAQLIVGMALFFSMITVSADELIVDDSVRAKLEPVLGKDGATLNYFSGPADMIGIGVTFANGRQMVVYATADGNTIFSGVAVDIATGQNISSLDAANLPPPNYDKVVEMAASATAFVEGNPESENQYYVFVDPRCPYCHKTYSAFLEAQAKGSDLAVHYIPIGILGPESENVAKEMLGNAEGAADLFRKISMKAPHVSDAAVVEEGLSAHGRNLAIFRTLQFDAVPVVISTVSGEQNVRRGAISAEAILAELTAVAKVASR
ncbi:MAG: hypothetical protein WBN07_02785 [Woeseiaceae bacterium]